MRIWNSIKYGEPEPSARMVLEEILHMWEIPMDLRNECHMEMALREKAIVKLNRTETVERREGKALQKMEQGKKTHF